MRGRRLNAEERWALIGIPVLFLVSCIMHFLYDWTGDNDFVGLFAPVNESIWEHLKLLVIPTMAWWSVYLVIGGNNSVFNYDRWFTGGLVSIVTALITMPMLYYFYTEAFGVESLVVDILLVPIVLILGQLLGLHVYKKAKGLPAYVVIIVFAVILIIFMWWSYEPPRLPLFMDGPTGTYGM